MYNSIVERSTQSVFWSMLDKIMMGSIEKCRQLLHSEIYVKYMQAYSLTALTRGHKILWNIQLNRALQEGVSLSNGCADYYIRRHNEGCLRVGSSVVSPSIFWWWRESFLVDCKPHKNFLLVELNISRHHCKESKTNAVRSIQTAADHCKKFKNPFPFREKCVCASLPAPILVASKWFFELIKILMRSTLNQGGILWRLLVRMAWGIG